MYQPAKLRGMNDSNIRNPKWTNISDATLMQRFQQGDNAAFEEIFHRYKRQIYNYAYRFLGNAAQSEEVVQEGFLKLIKLRDKYEPRAKFSTLLYTLVRNLCIDSLRKSSHLRLLKPNNDGDPPPVEKIAATAPSQQELAHRKELEDILQRAIQTLNPEQREVFLMREKLSLPFSEIAEVLGCAENTVKSRMRYALLSLRKYLSQYYTLEDVVT